MKKKLIIGILSAVLVLGIGSVGVIKGIGIYKDSVFYKTKRVNEVIKEAPKNEFMEIFYDEEDNTVFIFAETEEGIEELATNSIVGLDAWQKLKGTMVDYNKQFLEYLELNEIEMVNVHTIITTGPTREEIAEIRNGKEYSDSIEGIRKGF